MTASSPGGAARETAAGAAFLTLLAALAIAVPVLNLAVPASSPLHVSTYVLTLVGKYLCYAMLALAVDLVWGFCGILSLGHAAFFALGGYAMGMYLMRQIGTRGVYGNPILPDFMVFLNWNGAALVLARVRSLSVRAAHDGARARRAGVRVRLARVPVARDRRVSVDHDAGAQLRPDAGVLPQRHGLRRQQRVHRLQGDPRLRSAAGLDARRAARGHGAGACGELLRLPFHRRRRAPAA